MKMNKKKLAVVSLVLCVAAIISMNTLAWFTDNDSIVNEFNFVDDFAVDIYETNDEGEKVGVDGDTTGLTFENVLPGQTLHKDPTVLNKSSVESMWVKMTVTVGNVWRDGFLGAGASLQNLFLGYEDELWAHPDDVTLDENNNLVAVFYLKDKLAPGAEVKLFEEVYIHSAMTKEIAAQLNGTTLTVKADVVQTTAFPAEDCVSAFALVEGN
ncbi:MAG: SipW-dependent-type signal peptide-containing protein, partial [Firmicutes bacterium]|nr:SipW-dependent-type signal peptide-containing protein [Candidatus Colimorpha enterica]